MRGVAVLSVAAAMAACAGSSPRAPARGSGAVAPRVAAADDGFTDLFERTCTTCHSSTEPPMPDFTHEMSPELAALSLHRLTAHEMPPRDAKGLDSLNDSERERLVFGLCRKTNRSSEVCREMAASTVHPDLMRPGSVIAKLVEQKGAAPVPDSLRGMLAGAEAGGSSLRRTGTVAVVLMAALESCQLKADHEAADAGAAAPTRPAPKTEEERQRCVEELLRVGLERPIPVD